MDKEKILNDIINGRTKYSSIQYNSPNIIGSISKIFAENKFRNFEEYEKYYTSNVFGYEYLSKLSYRIYNDVAIKFDISPEEIYYYIVDLILVKSWDGFVERMKRAIAFLEKQMFQNIEYSNEECDREYAIDLFCDRNNKKYIVQVKPKSFLNSHYKYHYVQNLRKNLKFLNSFDPCLFVLYMFEENKKFTYKLFDKNSLEEEILAESTS